MGNDARMENCPDQRIFNFADHSTGAILRVVRDILRCVDL